MYFNHESQDARRHEKTGKLPTNLNLGMIVDAVERQQTTLDNPGFCLHCGMETDNVEPDARGYKCCECGRHEVYGAEELLLMFGGN